MRLLLGVKMCQLYDDGRETHQKNYLDS